MASELFPGTLQEVAARLNQSESHSIITRRSSSSGWQPILAFSPDAVFAGDMNTEKETIESFLSENKGRLIVGFITYEYGANSIGVECHPKTSQNLPDVYFAAYSNYLFEDRNGLKAEFSNPYYPGIIQSILAREPWTPAGIDLQFRPNIEHRRYLATIDRILNYIRQGEFYQVNYTYFMESAFSGNLLNLFLAMGDDNPVDYAAWLAGTGFSIASLSPELFVRTRGREIMTRPIKGTRPRGATPSMDRKHRRELLASAKEMAELNMITDLLRNDIGKIAQTNTVSVMVRRKVEKLAAVWHTHSEIRGTIKKSMTPIEAVLSMIPGGSVTGCPKKRAVEVIYELETQARGLYTGTIGLIYPNGDMDWNIAIRTLVETDGRVLLGVGGGITVDSEPGAEWQETLAKAKPFLEIIL